MITGDCLDDFDFILSLKVSLDLFSESKYVPNQMFLNTFHINTEIKFHAKWNVDDDSGPPDLPTKHFLGLGLLFQKQFYLIPNRREHTVDSISSDVA